ncbi:MAG: C10 family peptidase [Bacteroidetes bacterium]|nr:C10 family peptidase [Bacteroidota bacterium]
MKKKLLFIIISLFVLKANAQLVSANKAELVAKNFFYEKANTSGNLKYSSIKPLLIPDKELRLPKDMGYYMFNISNRKGFVIVASDEASYPILGYSLEDSIDRSQPLPPAFKDWMDGITQQIAAIKNAGLSPSPAINAVWKKYVTYNVTKQISTVATLSIVAPLLSTTWNQGCGYNALCPVDAGGPCGRDWTGCVATAMAQIMKYHSWPDTGVGTHSYNASPYGIQSADFGSTAYNWAAMPNNSGNTDVALLSYHCGVSVNMGYNPIGSGAFVSTYPFTTYFKYSYNCVNTSKSSYVDTNFKTMLRTELEHNRPILYTGYGPSGGHAFVCDGDDGTGKFHFNWGWGGSYNGYFFISNLNPGSYTWNNTQSVLIGIVPNYLESSMDTTGIATLTCGVSKSDSTNAHINIANVYKGCYYQETGPEVMYKITTTVKGRLKVQISNITGGDLDVFILSGVNRDSCIAFGDSIALAYDLNPGTYYVVVDGKYGSMGHFNITMNCPDTIPNLIGYNPQLSAFSLEPGQNNVGVFCKIKNVGQDPSSVCKVKYYYSVNNYYDVSDILLDSASIDTLTYNIETSLPKYLSMPSSMTAGWRYIVIKIDANNQVAESDETDNELSIGFTAVAPGVIDCTPAFHVLSDTAFLHNTLINGDSLIADYNFLHGLTGNEVIYKVESPYSGMMRITFSEKLMGDLYVLSLTSCNENLCDRTMSIFSAADTSNFMEKYVAKGVPIYIVVDGKNDISGAYYIQFKLPDSCANVLLTCTDTNKCITTGSSAFMYTLSGYSNCKWLKNGVEIPNETNYNYSAKDSGNYTVQVLENGCASNSNSVRVRFSPSPTGTPTLTASGTSICPGDKITLTLHADTGYTYRWLKNNMIIPSAADTIFSATESGYYTAQVVNGSCAVSPSGKTVNVYDGPGKFGHRTKFSKEKLTHYYSFTQNYAYMDSSGNNNFINASGPLLTYNRFNQYNSAYFLNGSADYLYASSPKTAYDTLSMVIWFKTSTTHGGRLIGFANKSWINSGVYSTTYDRHIYMDNSGKLYFGVKNGSNYTISSPASYNDGAWHMAVATLSSNGIQLFVDTALVAQNATPTSGQSYSGYWKVGRENLSGWTNAPDSSCIKGNVDDVLIYRRLISTDEIKNIYNYNILSYQIAGNKICGSLGGDTINIIHSQPGVNYNIKEHSSGTALSTTKAGTGANLQFVTDSFYTSSLIDIYAANALTGCGFILDSIPVYQMPVAAGSISGIATICQGTATVTYSVPAITNATSYVWTLPTGAIGTSTTNTINVTCGPSAVSGDITVKGNNSCGDGTTSTLTITVNPIYAFDENHAICYGGIYNWHGTDYSTNGTFTKYYTTTNGCDSIYTLHLTIDTVDVSLTVSDPMITANASAATYQWLDCDNSFTAISSATMQTYTATANGNYAVKITQGLCIDTSACIQIAALGVTSMHTEEISIYPNPVYNELTIDIKDNTKAINFEILNSIGQVVANGNFTGKTVIQTRSFAPGVFLLKLENGKIFEFQKIETK